MTLAIVMVAVMLLVGDSDGGTAVVMVVRTAMGTNRETVGEWLTALKFRVCVQVTLPLLTMWHYSYKGEL